MEIDVVEAGEWGTVLTMCRRKGAGMQREDVHEEGGGKAAVGCEEEGNGSERSERSTQRDGKQLAKARWQRLTGKGFVI